MVTRRCKQEEYNKDCASTPDRKGAKMEQVNGAMQKKQVLFSIGSYGERNSRVINKISAASIFSSATLPHNSRSSDSGTSRPRPISLDFTDSAPRYRTLPNPKFKSIAEKFNNGPSAMNNNDYSSSNKNIHINNHNNNNVGEGRKEQLTEKPACPPNTPSEVCVLMMPARNGSVEDKPAHPPKLTNRSISLEPEQLRNTGRVALTISAYEGDPRTPARLDFLPSPRSSRQLSRSSSKASNSTDGGGGTVTPTPTPVDPEPPTQIGSRLQDELVATLKRSNLREKNDDTAAMENGEILQVPDLPPPPPPPEQLDNGSVKQLATELGKRIMFRVNPENGEHICDNKA